MVKLIWMSLVVYTLVSSSSQLLQCPQKKGDAFYYTCLFNGNQCNKTLAYQRDKDYNKTCNETSQLYSFNFYLKYDNPDNVQPKYLHIGLYCVYGERNSSTANVTTKVEWNPEDPSLSRGERRCDTSNLTCGEINRIWPELTEGIEHIVGEKQTTDGTTSLPRSTTTSSTNGSSQAGPGVVTETMPRNQTRDSHSSGGSQQWNPALVVACVLGWLSALSMTLLAGYQRNQLKRRNITGLTMSKNQNDVKITTAKESTKPTATERTETSTLTDADLKSMTQQDASDASMMSQQFSINKTYVRTPTLGKSDSLKTTG